MWAIRISIAISKYQSIHSYGWKSDLWFVQYSSSICWVSKTGCRFQYVWSTDICSASCWVILQATHRICTLPAGPPRYSTRSLVPRLDARAPISCTHNPPQISPLLCNRHLHRHTFSPPVNNQRLHTHRTDLGRLTFSSQSFWHRHQLRTLIHRSIHPPPWRDATTVRHRSHGIRISIPGSPTRNMRIRRTVCLCSGWRMGFG